jgi:hypothetical protein
MAQCIYNIPRECGRIYTDETGWPLAVRFREHRHKLQTGPSRKIKISSTCPWRGS